MPAKTGWYDRLMTVDGGLMTVDGGGNGLKTLTTALLLFFLTIGAWAQTLLIQNVTAIDPASDEVRGGVDVFVRDGKIEAITDSADEAQPADDVQVLDGTGRFLVPGLWDMHVHLDMHTEVDLAMLVANGVLHVRDMGGDPFLAKDLEARIAAGDLVGPHIRAAGTIVEDRRWLTRARLTFPGLEHRVPVDNPEEARATVALLASWGVDLIKTRNVTDRETLAALLEAAREHGLTVAGHEPLVVDIDEAARLGMTTFEHLPFMSLTMPGKVAGEERLEATIASLVEAGSYVVPTMIASRGLGQSREDRKAAIDEPDERYAYLPGVVREAWYASLEGDAGPLPWEPMRSASIAITRRMHEAGVRVLAGTDMGVPLSFPGTSLHDELGLLVADIGLEPLDALRAATSAAASLFDSPGGRVSEGAPADLMLLDANPIDDIANTRAIRAVIVKGELYDRSRLDGLLETVRKTKDDWRGWDTLERLEEDCEASDEVSVSCSLELAGYELSKGRYDRAFSLYESAHEQGAGPIAIEGLFASAINRLFDGQLDCAGATPPFDALLEIHAGSPDRTVGTLDRVLPALAAANCEVQRTGYLERLATVERSSLSPALEPIFVEHKASYLAAVEGDEAAAFELRTSVLDPSWRDDTTDLQKIATWCLESRVALGTARDLAKRAAQVAATPIDRLQSMMLEARVASAAGDHDDAVGLMEFIDRAVPNNRTVTDLLEEFRRLAAAD